MVRTACEHWSKEPTRELVFFVLCVIVVSLGLIFSSDLDFATATVARVSQSSAAQVSPHTLLLLRTVFAASIAHSLVARLREEPTLVSPLRNPLSRAPPATVSMRGLVIFSTFTVQSWMLLWVYFSGAALLSGLSLLGLAPSGVLGTALSAFLWIAFEVSFTVSILVSAVTTYILIPKTLKSGQVPMNFFRYPQQAMHNLNLVFTGVVRAYEVVANAFALEFAPCARLRDVARPHDAGTELLLNDLPLNPAHLPFAVLWGIHYVLFSWWWLRRAGVCYYPFLDPTIPPSVSCKVHLILICVLALNFGLGLAVATAAASLPLAARACFVYFGASTLMWTRLRGVPQPAHPPARSLTPSVEGFQG